MKREEIIRIANGTGAYTSSFHGRWIFYMDDLERFAARVTAAEREVCAKVCEEKKEYSMPIPCPDGISGCLVAHYIPARREKTGSECAADIRARGEK